MKNRGRTWLARALIGAVFLFNVQCAIAFLVWPGDNAPAFELGGPAGEGMLRGMGILFLMWNVPYAFALWDPARRRLSLLEAILMQAIGVAGETLLLLGFPPGHPQVVASVTRFILFDASGLVLLLLAAWLSRSRPISSPDLTL